jgi:hypothetical protein
MARPRKAENETRTNFTVRLSTGERERILHNARLLKMTPSDYGRVCMMQGPAKVIHEEGHDPEKVRALLAVGNNLNQIARHANATGQIDPTELHEVLAMVRAILTEAGRQAWSRA